MTINKNNFLQAIKTKLKAGIPFVSRISKLRQERAAARKSYSDLQRIKKRRDEKVVKKEYPQEIQEDKLEEARQKRNKEDVGPNY